MKISEENALFSAHHIHVRRGGKNLLRDVSLTLQSATITAIIGPNGAGKSTLLKTMSGEISPDSGEVVLRGISLKNMKAKEIAQRRAVLPQHSDLSFPFLAYEVVLMGREPHLQGIESEYDHFVVWKAMQSVDILHLAQRSYHQLSGGERQRVHLARVMAQIWPRESNEAKFLLLDEPTSNLDLSHQYALLKTARGLADLGVGIMIILHDLNLAAHCADQIVVLHQGEVVVSDSPEKALDSHLLETVFGLPMEMIVHPINGRKFHIPCIERHDSVSEQNYSMR